MLEKSEKSICYNALATMENAMITLKLNEWEVMVLRAALAKHLKDAPPKHRETCKEIDRKSRAQDFKNLKIG